jgi:argininosuccinate lyase
VSREDVESALDPAESVASRDSAGGPAPEAVGDELGGVEAGIEGDRDALAAERDALADARETLHAEVERYV